MRNFQVVVAAPDGSTVEILISETLLHPCSTPAEKSRFITNELRGALELMLGSIRPIGTVTKITMASGDE